MYRFLASWFVQNPRIMYIILVLKSQDFAQNSTICLGGKSQEIVKILGAKLSRNREIITAGRGRSFDQTSFDEECKLRLSFLACFNSSN